jgi:hypothetical protein
MQLFNITLSSVLMHDESRACTHDLSSLLKEENEKGESELVRTRHEARQQHGARSPRGGQRFLNRTLCVVPCFSNGYTNPACKPRYRLCVTTSQALSENHA